MREAAEHEANERRRADPPEARKGNASPQPYHQHREQMIDAAQRMEQTGGKARQSVVAGMGRYRPRDRAQKKHGPTKRDTHGRSIFGERQPHAPMKNETKSPPLAPAETYGGTKQPDHPREQPR